MLSQSIPVGLPAVTGPLPITEDSYPFSTMQHATEPVNLADFGYLEEEYILSGTARTYRRTGATAHPSEELVPYATRVLVRRPAQSESGVVWTSILNASQGYDVEDDWRRAWDYIISSRDTYVAITAKPINADALVTFDPARYEGLTWGGPLPGLIAEPGWNPFQVISASEEGLAWDIIGQTAAWVRSGQMLPAGRRVFLMGQSQSGVYTNTYLTFFHDLLRLADGGPIFDGYLPGVASVFCRELVQDRDAGPQAALEPLLLPPADIDAPVIAVSTDGDTELFAGGSDAFTLGDGPMRRHWHVAGAPHSDARSRVIPANSEIRRAGRLPRVVDDALLARLSVLPVEPVVTAAMSAILRWVDEGVPAAPSAYFAGDSGRVRRDDNGNALGGVRLGLLAEPLAVFHGAATENPVYGSLELLSRDAVLARYPDLDAYRAACDVHDDVLQAQGYLEPRGRELLHAVGAELWHRVVDGAAPLRVTPQCPRPLNVPAH